MPTGLHSWGQPGLGELSHDRDVRFILAVLLSRTNGGFRSVTGTGSQAGMPGHTLRRGEGRVTRSRGAATDCGDESVLEQCRRGGLLRATVMRTSPRRCFPLIFTLRTRAGAVGTGRAAVTHHIRAQDPVTKNQAITPRTTAFQAAIRPRRGRLEDQQRMPGRRTRQPTGPAPDRIPPGPSPPALTGPISSPGSWRTRRGHLAGALGASRDCARRPVSSRPR